MKEIKDTVISSDGTVQVLTQGGAELERKFSRNMPDGKPAAARYTGIMPPCTVDRDPYLDKCTRCGKCIEVCPQHILHPAEKDELGPQGEGAPAVSFENGWCLRYCNRCAEACPTGAINLLSIAEKADDRLGWATFNRRTCITQTDDVDCNACVRHCPTHALSVQEFNGHKIPVVRISQCIGCGACEFYCPARPKAIHVEGLKY